MRLHGTFYALRPAAQPLVDMLNAEEVYDGAYSRVVPFAPHAVLKATICEPTNLLLRTLARRKKFCRTQAHLALPAVLDSHGVVARDDDGLDYTGWTLERLFEPGDHEGMRHARVAGREALTRVKPMYRGRYCQRISNQVDKLRDALSKHQKTWGHENGWEACAHIALSMSLQTEGDLKATFLFLQKFVTTHKVALDLLTRGNIMVNFFGELTLSDPVCEHDETQQPAPACSTKLVCLSAWVPASMDGLNISVLPMSTEPLSIEAVSARAAEMEHLGLQPVSMEWGSPEHVAFLEEGPKQTKVWAFENAIRRMRENHYIQLFKAPTSD